MVMADSASADGHIHSRYLHGLQEKEDVLEYLPAVFVVYLRTIS
jgi:hypothetical protein